MREIAGDIWELYQKGCWLILEVSRDTSGRFIVNNKLNDSISQSNELYDDIVAQTKKTKEKCFAIPSKRLVVFISRNKFNLMDMNLFRESIRDLIKMEAQVNEYVKGNKEITNKEVTLVLPMISSDLMEWERTKIMLSGVLDDQFSLVESIEVAPLKAQKVRANTSAVEYGNIDESVIPSFKCPICGKLIELQEASGEYFAIYGQISLGEEAESLKSSTGVDKLGRPRPVRMCASCFPKYLTERAATLKKSLER